MDYDLKIAKAIPGPGNYLFIQILIKKINHGLKIKFNLPKNKLKLQDQA